MYVNIQPITLKGKLFCWIVGAIQLLGFTPWILRKFSISLDFFDINELVKPGIFLVGGITTIAIITMIIFTEFIRDKNEN